MTVTSLNMSQKVTRRKHGQHNFDLCKHLTDQKIGVFNDWIITTAFYSSIHFIYSELFPGKFSVEGELGKEYSTFESLYSYYFKTHRLSKHNFTEHLVSEYLEDVQDEFKFLKDTCHTARYSNYVIANDRAQEAMDALIKIKNLCTPTEEILKAE